MCWSLEPESDAGGHHWWGSGVDGVDDLGVVDALEVDAGDAEVGVSELALDHVQRVGRPAARSSISAPVARLNSDRTAQSRRRAECRPRVNPTLATRVEGPTAQDAST